MLFWHQGICQGIYSIHNISWNQIIRHTIHISIWVTSCPGGSLLVLGPAVTGTLVVLGPEVRCPSGPGGPLVLLHRESKLWSCDISQSKSLNVLTKLVLLTSMTCSHASNVRMHWGTALYWWDRKWTLPNMVLNPSKVMAQKFGIFYLYHLRPTYL